MAQYVGRFAPSPTGPLHFGSLIAAIASHLDARARGGRWLVRIEDLDPPRTITAAADAILRALEAHALPWDGTVVRQSERNACYEAALSALERSGRLFYCTCSRRTLEGCGVYPGRCRSRRTPPQRPHSIRIEVPAEYVEFEDRLQGHVRVHLASEIGDFVLLRRDAVYAYQLAVVVDDAAQQVTDVVRGADLLDSTPRQLYLHGLLGTSPPAHAHVPIAVDRSGAKLSKQTFATPIDARTASATLHAAISLLGQEPPGALVREPAPEVIRWAIEHWNIDRVPRAKTIGNFTCL